jgi:hypothetical protein
MVSIVDSRIGLDWHIEKDGEVIAQSHNMQFRTPQEAIWSAQGWAQRHIEMGYELRPNWTEVE